MLLATPFRLFFLLAGLIAALWIPAWVVVLLRGMPLSSNLGAMGWHAHEMVFGYTGAVLAGFFLTATRNWTKHETLSGWGLVALAAVWASGRAIALHTTALPVMLPVLIDAAFWFGLAAAIARPIIKARSKRNLAFPALLALIGACDAIVHLHVSHKISPVWSARAVQVALDSLALIILIFAGRIVPMFTSKVITTLTPRSKGWLDWLGLGLMSALLVCHAVMDPTALTYWVAIAAGVVNGARLWGWGGASTLRSPLLWVLHLGWLFLTAGVTLHGISGLVESVPPNAATHLFTVGGLGVTTLGMMARVSLGHTGRKLQAPTSVAIGFAILVVAVIVRVGVPWAWPQAHLDAVKISGIAWAIAFVLFTARFTPIWLAPRADGKPG